MFPNLVQIASLTFRQMLTCISARCCVSNSESSEQPPAHIFTCIEKKPPNSHQKNQSMQSNGSNDCYKRSNSSSVKRSKYKTRASLSLDGKGGGSLQHTKYVYHQPSSHSLNEQETLTCDDKSIKMRESWEKKDGKEIKSAAKKAAANTNQTGGGGSHSPNCGAGGGGTYSPLGTSPTTNSLLSSFTSSNLSHQPQRQQETNNNSHCFTHKGESLQSDQHSTAGHHPQVANFNISSFPHSLVGALRGSANTTPGSESSPNESADELNCSGISSATMGLGFGGGAGGNHPAYLASCATLERTRRYQECKIMVQLPRGFDRLEWLAYHATFLVRFVGMFWLSNHLSQHCQCTNLSAPPNNSVWTMTDERTGKKSGHKSAIDAKTAIENSLKNLEKILDNEDLFPSKYGNQFNNDFENLVKRSCRSLFCILTHLLHAHFHSLVEKKVDASTIDLFSYLITFARQFTLIDKKDFAAAEQIEQVLNQLHN